MPAVDGSHQTDGGPEAAEGEEDPRTGDLQEGVDRDLGGLLLRGHREKSLRKNSGWRKKADKVGKMTFGATTEYRKSTTKIRVTRNKRVLAKF